MPRNTTNITIAAASFRSDSPSTRRVRRAGAPTSRKTAITAAGSVVAITEPSRRQTTSGRPETGHNAKPTTAVVDDGRDNGEHQDWSRVLEHPAHVDGDRALEHQERQENIDERLGAHRQVDENRRNAVEAIGDRRVQQDNGASADRHPDNREEHHRRELESHRDRLGDGDDDQQRCEYGQKDDDVEHGGQSPNRSARFGATGD